MKKWNKLFGKKPKAEDGDARYTATSSSVLRSMSNEELTRLIFTYDDEVKRLNGLVEMMEKEKEDGEGLKEQIKLLTAQSDVSSYPGQTNPR